MVKSPAMQDPWVGKIPWRRKWQPTPVILPGKFHEQRSLAGYSPWGCKESGMTEQLSLTHREEKCEKVGIWGRRGSWNDKQYNIYLSVRSEVSFLIFLKQTCYQYKILKYFYFKIWIFKCVLKEPQAWGAANVFTETHQLCQMSHIPSNELLIHTTVMRWFWS